MSMIRHHFVFHILSLRPRVLLSSISSVRPRRKEDPWSVMPHTPEHIRRLHNKHRPQTRPLPNLCHAPESPSKRRVHVGISRPQIMRRSGSRALDSSSRPIVSPSPTAKLWFCDREEAGGDPCGRVNIVRNKAESHFERHRRHGEKDAIA